MNDYELIGRLADLDMRLKKLEGVEPAPAPRTPRPPLSLFEEVANLCDWVENTWMGSHKDKTISVRLALAAEKRIAEKQAILIDYLRVYRSSLPVEVSVLLAELDEECAR